MLNIHPGLLPAFGGKGLYGLRVHKAVIASGARFSGATVHFVDEQYDTGPILAQAIVPVNPHDTPQMLAARVLKQVDYHMADVSKAPIAYRLSFEMLNVESVMQNCCHEFGCKQHFAAQPIACPVGLSQLFAQYQVQTIFFAGLFGLQIAVVPSRHVLQNCCQGCFQPLTSSTCCRSTNCTPLLWVPWQRAEYHGGKMAYQSCGRRTDLDEYPY